MSDDELATSIKAIRTLRRETNLALERLPTRNAQRVHDPLHAERKATNRLLTMLVSYVEETGATLRRIEERPIAWPPLARSSGPPSGAAVLGLRCPGRVGDARAVFWMSLFSRVCLPQFHTRRPVHGPTADFDVEDVDTGTR
jgi:hypothetical protein